MVVNWLLFNFCRSFGQQKIHTKCPVSDLVCCPDILLHTGKGFPWLLYANTLGTPVLGFMIMSHNLLHILKLQIIYVIWLLRTSVQNIHHVINLTFTQGTLEFEYPDPRFHVEKGSNETYQNFDIFAHGGMIFLITSSLVFFLVSDGLFTSGNRAIKLKQAHIWSNSRLFVRNI